MKSLGEVIARFRARRDDATLEKAELEQVESPAERRVENEDFEARKDDVQLKEYLPGVDDDSDA
jgi:hypothetical protein